MTTSLQPWVETSRPAKSPFGMIEALPQETAPRSTAGARHGRLKPMLHAQKGLVELEIERAHVDRGLVELLVVDLRGEQRLDVVGLERLGERRGLVADRGVQLVQGRVLGELLGLGLRQ